MKLAVFQSAGGGLSIGERFQKLTDAVTKTNCDLLICPELYTSGYNVGDALPEVAKNQSDSFIEQVSALANSTSTALVLGYPELAGKTLYNSAIFIGSDGQTLANHRKLAIPPGDEGDHFTSGNEMTFVEYMGVKCAILVCYDAEFPETVRAVAKIGAELVIVPTALNSGWPVVADKVMPTRAFENGVWLAYANHAGSEGGLEYYGHSCIVRPTGQDAARAGLSEEILTAEIDKKSVKAAQARLPYLKDLTKITPLL
jgi:predicted amidohydrolase